MKNLKMFGKGWMILLTVLLALVVVYTQVVISPWIVICLGTGATLFSITQTKLAKTDVVLYVVFLIAIFLIKWL